jgi:prepilin-type N-terminal cleavage/methylation domain-containing protein
MKLQKLKSNKGFSLIEMLVSFAIFGILCVALVGFISMSSRTYRRTSDLINLQVEYQIVMTMLNEYIMDCNGSITFNNNTLTIANQGETPYVFRLDGGELLLGDALVSRNVVPGTFTVWRDEENLLSVGLAFSPTNPHDARTYSAEQSIALRNSPNTAGIPPRPEPPPDGGG